MLTFNLLEWEPLVLSGEFCFASIIYLPLDALEIVLMVVPQRISYLELQSPSRKS